jgi:CMP-N-acetylneuraminic acid synthetase
MNVLSVAASYGHKDYYIRPDEYATPECPVEEAIAHALYYLKCKSLVTDYVCLIHPTSPCLRAETLYQAMTLLADTPSADMLISVTDANVPHGTIPVTNNMGPYLSAASQRKRTQDCPKRFKLNNAIVAGRWDVFAGKEDYCLQRVIQFPMAASDSVDIDTQDDLNIAEAILMWREKNERKS